MARMATRRMRCSTPKPPWYRFAMEERESHSAPAADPLSKRATDEKRRLVACSARTVSHEILKKKKVIERHATKRTGGRFRLSGDPLTAARTCGGGVGAMLRRGDDGGGRWARRAGAQTSKEVLALIDR